MVKKISEFLLLEMIISIQQNLYREKKPGISASTVFVPFAALTLGPKEKKERKRASGQPAAVPTAFGGHQKDL